MLIPKSARAVIAAIALASWLPSAHAQDEVRGAVERYDLDNGLHVVLDPIARRSASPTASTRSTRRGSSFSGASSTASASSPGTGCWYGI